MPIRMDGIWLQDKRQNKNVAIFLILFLCLEIFLGVYTAIGLDIIGYNSLGFRAILFFSLLWIGIGLYKRKLAAI